MNAAQRMLLAFLNDPGDKRAQPEKVLPGRSGARFQIPGLPRGDGARDAQPGTLGFQAEHLCAILSHTYDLWAGYFGSDFDWQPGQALTVVPRAGQDLNAYYDRRALKFFYATNTRTGATIYTAESADIAAHECGHAVLDAQHPDYWDSLHPETAAFHEAFGDISALLTTLQFPSVRARWLEETDGNLRRSNSISRLAEQLGRALYDQFGKQACSPRALRDMVNSFRYAETYTLPARAPASQLSSESHSFSRVFSGAFYQVLIGIYELKRKVDSNLSADDALAAARDDAGALIAQALLLSPPGDAVFRVIALSLFKADAQRFQGQYFDLLKQVITKRRILAARDVEDFKPHTGMVGAKVTPGELGLLKVDEQAVAQPPESLLKMLNVEPEQVTRTRQLRTADEQVVQYSVQRSIELKGKQFGPANGARIPIQGGLTLSVSPQGDVTASNLYRAGQDDLRAVRDHVAKLAERDRIYDTRPGDELDITHLITRRQPYFIDFDPQGNKVLRRAFISCECARCRSAIHP